MKKRRNPRTKSILICTFCLLFGWADTRQCTDEIQLRKYPKSDGQVLDTISKDRNFKIVEKFGSWRYILVKGSTYGGGWVHFKELEDVEPASLKVDAVSQRAKTDAPTKPGAKKSEDTVKTPSPKSGVAAKGKDGPKSPSHGKVSVGTVKIHPLPPAENTGKTEPDRPQRKDPLPNKRPPSPSSEEKRVATVKEPWPSQESIGSKRRPSQDMELTPHASLPTERKGREKDVHRPQEDGSLAFVQTAHADALPKPTVPSENTVKASEKTPSLPVNVADASDTVAVPVESGGTQSLSVKKENSGSYPDGIRDFMNFGFKLLSVVLSCLAIIFSYKAKRMAAMSYQLVVRLQQNLEISRRREFDERYE
jgi:hypothetical protein